MADVDTAQSLESLKMERDAIVLYDALAGMERDAGRAATFRSIAADERRHADLWAARLHDQGVDVPPEGGIRTRIRAIIAIARLFGTRSVSEMVEALEGGDEASYAADASPEIEQMAADERRHGQLWRELRGSTPARKAAPPAGVGADLARVAGSLAGRDEQAGVAAAQAASSPHEIARQERWHRTGQSGTLRAVIFGVSDGLVSNTSLVMGVAGAAAEPRFILLAGIAGLLAGAFSMAAGEYVSMQSQRELFERQIALERAELAILPEEEEAELATVYRAKGFTEAEASQIAHRVVQDPGAALDTLLREELGIDPNELGSPWGAALGSFLAFAVGASVPVAPYLLGGDALVFGASIGLSLGAMFLVGVGVSLLTGRSALFSGARQVLIGLLAAAVTYGVGRLIGVSVS